MADLKISQLTGATTPLAGTEVVPVVQSGATKKVSIANLTTGRTISATPLTWASLYDAHAVKSEHTSLFGFFDGNEQIAGVVQGAFTNASFATVLTQATQPAGRSYHYNGNFFVQRAPSGAVGGTAAFANVISTDANLNVKVDAGNLVIGTSGKGIDFSATPGTGTSELLNDYEEGTWTPSDTSGAGLSLTITGTSTYTKIGRQVIVNADITYPVTADASLTLVGGLPFTTATAPNGAGSIGYTDYGNWITPAPGGGVTAFRFVGASAFLTNAQLSGKRVQVCITYIV